MTKHFQLETKNAPDPLDQVQKALDEIQKKAAGTAKLGEQIEGLSDMLRDVGSRVERIEKRDARERIGMGSIPSGSFVKPEDARHAELFAKMLRNPKNEQVKAELQEIERKTATGATDGAGGFLVPEVLVGPLLKRAANANPFRGLVRVVQVATRDVAFPLSNGDATTGWVGENVVRTGTTEPTLISPKPTFGTLYALVEATEELTMDSAFDVASWFSMEAGDKMAEAEMAAIVSGDGVNKPTGLLHVAPEAGADGARTAGAFRYLATGNATTLGSAPSDRLIDMIYSLKAAYRMRGTWIMNSQVAGEIRKLKDSNGRFLWTDGIAAGQPSTLLGYPVEIVEAMPGIAANTHPIAFGDFNRAFVLAENGGLRVTVNDNISVPGKVIWYVRRRLGGITYDNDAVRFLRVSAT